jgi:hypothetical protein
MNKLSVLFIFIFVLAWLNVSYPANFLPDEPEFRRNLSEPYPIVDSYNQALGVWKSAGDINRWISGNFIYDKERAIKLSTDQRAKNKGISIYTPSDFFEIKAGICVDLARFGVETLRIVEPISYPKYLMIEFVPIQMDGATFRLHWLVSFLKDGMKYFFCDSKRPGFISGPYKNTKVFISEYEQYRGRKIVTYRELESYRKQRKSKSEKMKSQKSPNKAN